MACRNVTLAGVSASSAGAKVPHDRCRLRALTARMSLSLPIDVLPPTTRVRAGTAASSLSARAYRSRKVCGDGRRPDHHHQPFTLNQTAGIMALQAILAQLLCKQGLFASVVEHEAVSRKGVETRDLEGVAMVCIAYLEIKGNPSHLRYLLQRLRERLPRQKLLVGLWPAEDAAMSDEAVRREIGADVYVSSLRDAVDGCIAEARSEGQATPARAA